MLCCPRPFCKDWVALAEEVVAHEFPSWRLLASFEVFHLSDSARQQDFQSSSDQERHLERLAQAFGVCAVKVKEQYARLSPIAAALKKQSGMSNREAWKEAILRTGQRQASHYEATALRTLVSAYQCWTVSSSGVEQLFSKLQRSPVELSNANADTDRRCAIVMGDGHSQADQAEILREARKIYASLLQSGQSRSRTLTRKRFDCEKKGATKVGSFAQWNQARKKAVQRAVQESQETPPRRPSQPQNESSQKESNYQRKQAIKRKAEALRDGLLLDHEITEEVRVEAERVAKANRLQDNLRAKQRKEYELGTRLVTVEKTESWACQNLSGPAWCCPSLASQQEEIVAALKKHGVRNCTQEIFLCLIFVVHVFFH